MISFIIRRTAVMVPIMLMDSLLIFLLVSAAPGDRARVLAGSPDATPEQLQQIRLEYHLDESVFVQYWYWLVDVVKLDFGWSRTTNSTVVQEISARLPITAAIVFAAVVIALVIAVPIGIVSGIRPGHTLDNLGRLIATIGLAVPSFVVAILGIYYFGVKLQWLPIVGYVSFTESPYEWLLHVVLPAIALGAALAAYVMRQLRAGMVDTLDSSYVRAAWARGGRPRRVIGLHALKNASLPTITVLGFAIAAILGGSAIIEEIFDIPGLGSYIVSSVMAMDVPPILAVTMLLVLIQLVTALLLDISYGWLNPKIRVS